jgi:HEAT repeat protein
MSNLQAVQKVGPRTRRSVLLTLAQGALLAGLMLLTDIGRAQTPSEKAWGILKSGIAEKSTERRATAVRVLGLIQRDTQAAAAAKKALAEDDKEDVRAAAATALGQMRAPGAISALKKALNDKEFSVQLAAAQALMKLGDPSGYDLYYAILTGERKAGTGLLVEGMKTIRDPKKIAEFSFEQGIGYIPFAGIGYDAIRALKKDDASPIRAAAAKVLATDPDSTTDHALVNATSDKNWIVRVAALEALALRGHPKLLPDIAPKMADENYEVRLTAAAAVIRLSNLAKPAKRPR